MSSKKSLLQHQTRSASRIAEHLNHRLVAYAASATAAGVSLLAAAAPAQAEVIYTPKTGTITNGRLLIDLDQNGVSDFELGIHSHASLTSWGARYGYVGVTLGGDSAGGSLILSNGSAAVLASGSVIGSSRTFTNIHTKRGHLVHGKFFVDSSFSNRTIDGNWKNVRDRFLGVRFDINGATHYGWIRLSVRVGSARPFTATVKGFAYESNAGQSINAGQTAEGQIGAATNVSGSLGQLARGAAPSPSGK